MGLEKSNGHFWSTRSTPLNGVEQFCVMPNHHISKHHNPQGFKMLYLIFFFHQQFQSCFFVRLMWLTHGKKTHFHLSKNLPLNDVESKCHSFSGPPGLPNKSNKKLTNNDFNKPICSMGLEFLPTFGANLWFYIPSYTWSLWG